MVMVLDPAETLEQLEQVGQRFLGPGGWWKFGENHFIRYFPCASSWADGCLLCKAGYRKASNETRS